MMNYDYKKANPETFLIRVFWKLDQIAKYYYIV